MPSPSGSTLPCAALLLAGGLAACGRSEPSAPAGRVRLWERPARLLTQPVPPAQEVLREDFEVLPEGWRLMQDPAAPLSVDPTRSRTEIGREEGRTFLTVSGQLGSFYRVVAVEPNTPYLFTGALRVRTLERTPGHAGEAFHGALFWLGEYSQLGPPEEMFARGGFVERRHALSGVEGRTGWQEERHAWRTGPGTHALLIGCLLATTQEALVAGAVDYDGVQLRRIDERELWEFEAARAVAAAHRGDALPAGEDGRARRRVDALVGGEQRPALLCLPGERLAFELDLPAGAAHFTCGLAPWPAAARGAGGPQAYWLRVEERELVRVPLASDAATGWHEVSLSLAEFSGRRVRLELGLEGALPGLFGAPQVFARAPPSSPWNVLFVSVDTLRADRVGAYGASSGATPRLDELARRALLFTDMSANAPYTLPAHATLFSGQFPSVHAVEDRGRLLAPRRSPILARILAARGYATQAFAAGGFLHPDFGFHAGFDGFSIVDPLRHPGSRYFEELRRELPAQCPPELTAEPGVERVRRWLGAHAAEPFFLFLHTYQVHDYDPPPGTLACAARGCTSTLADFRELMFPKRLELFPGSPEDRAHLTHLYDAALADVDRQLGLVFDELARLGLAERTLIVVTSDHGEELFERGRLQHGKTLHDEQLAIPWILAVPGHAPARMAVPAMQVDVAPTVLGALGLPPDARMQGLDLLRERPRERVLWAEVNDHFVRRASLRAEGWKLLHAPPEAAVSIPAEREWELFELATDPGEERERSAIERERLARLQRQLAGFQGYLDGLREQLGTVEQGELGEATERLLKQLGY